MNRCLVVTAIVSVLIGSHIIAEAKDESALRRIEPVAVTASSSADANSAPEKAADGNDGTRWSSKKTDRESITLDLGKIRTIGRIALKWETACAEIYQVQVSTDGKEWRVVFADANGEPGDKVIDLEPVSARYVRMYGLKKKTDWGYSLFRFDAYASRRKPVAPDRYPLTSQFSFERTKLQPHAYYVTDAETAPKGYYPLWVSNQQGYWTLTGTPDGSHESLICEDGTIEPYRRGWSLMPYLHVDGELLIPQQGNPQPTLEDGYLPLPGVHCAWGDLHLDQELFTARARGGDVSYITYRITNKGPDTRAGRLYVTLRPFQVDPSWQGEGGMADVFSIRLAYDTTHNVVLVNEKQRLRLVTPPDASGGITYMEGGVMDFVAKDRLPPHTTVFDPWGGATAAFRYDFSLKAGDEVAVHLGAPLDPNVDITGTTPENIPQRREQARRQWTDLLNKVRIGVPDTRLADVLRSNLAYILINADPPVLQPGSRHYERSWIRDGCVIGIALLRTGHAKEARDYIEWIANHQLFNGDVPCMINADGSVWEWGRTLPEYDGQGAFVTLISEYYKYTGDRELLDQVFPNVVKALEFLEYLRGQRLTEKYANARGEDARYYGLLPLSVSHEGYAAPGKHSYWDIFFALRGWHEGSFLSSVVGRDDLVPWMKKQEAALRESFHRSIQLTQRDKNITYIPGCADLGDLDASATAISVWPAYEHGRLDQKQLHESFNRFYDETLMPRLAGKADPVSGYVPYEMRIATAWLVTGEKEKAWTLLDHFLDVMRPQAWNHWAEVVYPDASNPGYIGDMPHAWAGADFINALRTAFVYETDDGQVILGLGFREEWLKKDKPLTVQGLPTHYGKINYTILAMGDRVKMNVSGDLKTPAGGFIAHSPRDVPARSARVNGEPVEVSSDGSVRFPTVPADILFEY